MLGFVGGVYSSSMSNGVILDAVRRDLEDFAAVGRAGLTKDGDDNDTAGLETCGGPDCIFGFVMSAVGFGADAVAGGLVFGR